jgi:hypothetical protein
MQIITHSSKYLFCALMPVLEKHRNISASGNLAEAAAVKELDFIFFMDS